ncbi:hypothetical protein KBD61_04530 [Patescibacteria group bacterium]|nr:hypothetical protein [Patescibacteria group bacterium]MBP9710261.1 hypothetical protein [Patescibacteria group bacterium]
MDSSHPQSLLTQEQVEQWHTSLPADRREWLKDARGLSDQVINEAKLGWDGGCFTIPIKSSSGEWLFAKRRYPPEFAVQGLRYKNASGSTAALYGVELIQGADTVFIAEGELDSLILRSKGLVAVSSTSGCSTFNPAWATFFASIPNVYVLYDNDDGGKEGAKKVGSLIPHAKIVHLPPEVGEKGDVTDFFMKLGKTKEDLLELLETGRPASELKVAEEPVDSLDNLLSSVPKDTRLETLPSRLNHLWKVLHAQDQIDPTLFIDNNVREYFSLQKGKMKPFHQAYSRAKQFCEMLARDEARASEKIELLQTEVSSAQALEAISKVGIVDPAILDLVIATYVSAKLGTAPPIWLMLVGAPSSFKTELVRLIDLPEIYSLDTLSENAFASGYIRPDGSDPEDLLPLLNGKCFVVKDLTTLFSLKEDTVKKILGDLTSIFDGKYEKFTATRGHVSYLSQFSMVGCITPAVLSQHHRYMHQLGGRFFFVRVPELTEDTLKRGHVIAWDASHRTERIKEARQIVSTYCHQQSEKALAIFPEMEVESPEVQAWVNTAADFIAHARGTTITKSASFENDEGKTVEYYEVSDPQIEQPWRLLNQLRSLARVLAAMRGKTAITKDELKSLEPIVLSSMPIDRAVILVELIGQEYLTPKMTSELISKSAKTAARDLKELSVLGLVDAVGSKESKAKWYALKPKYKEFFSDFTSTNGLI